jgi:hypothetical protein
MNEVEVQVAARNRYQAQPLRPAAWQVQPLNCWRAKKIPSSTARQPECVARWGLGSSLKPRCSSSDERAFDDIVTGFTHTRGDMKTMCVKHRG